MLENNPNQKDSAHYLNLLEQELKNIEEALINDQQIEMPDTGDDSAENQETRDQQEEIVKNYLERKREIERAIKWTKENGSICAVCRQPIEESRRDADPASITCKAHRDEDDTIEI